MKVCETCHRPVPTLEEIEKGFSTYKMAVTDKKFIEWLKEKEVGKDASGV